MPKPQEDSQTSLLSKLVSEVEAIGDQMQTHAIKPRWRRWLSELAHGMLYGIGFALGTTVLFAFIIYFLQLAIDWTHIQGSITDWIGQTAQEGAYRALDDDFSKFLGN